MQKCVEGGLASVAEGGDKKRSSSGGESRQEGHGGEWKQAVARRLGSSLVEAHVATGGHELKSAGAQKGYNRFARSVFNRLAGRAVDRAVQTCAGWRRRLLGTPRPSVSLGLGWHTQRQRSRRRLPGRPVLSVCAVQASWVSRGHPLSWLLPGGSRCGSQVPLRRCLVKATVHARPGHALQAWVGTAAALSEKKKEKVRIGCGLRGAAGYLAQGAPASHRRRAQ